MCFASSVFFFQAEDGIRDVAVTGVQTCALPISAATSLNYPLYQALGADFAVAIATAPIDTTVVTVHDVAAGGIRREFRARDRKSTRLNSSHGYISYAVFCLKKKKNTE